MKAFNNRFLVVPFAFGLTVEEIMLSAIGCAVLVVSVILALGVHIVLGLAGIPAAIVIFKKVYKSWSTHDTKRIQRVIAAGNIDANIREIK